MNKTQQQVISDSLTRHLRKELFAEGIDDAETQRIISEVEVAFKEATNTSGELTAKN